MTVHDLFTLESREQYKSLTKKAVEFANCLMREYRSDHADESQRLELREWIDALEDGNLDVAASRDLWSRLTAEGFIDTPTNQAVHPDHARFDVKIISPKIFDAFQTNGESETTYAYTTLKVCLRREEAPKSLVPNDWEDVAIIDTEVFELPHGTTLDPEDERNALDDMEKIHLIYIAGTKDGQVASKPVYIGVGTGEAYGTGPSRRETTGRFRFYRYDAKDNNHLEFIKVTEEPELVKCNVDTLPQIPPIGEGDSRQVLLGRGGCDSGFMCLSDQIVATVQKEFFDKHYLRSHVTKVVKLEKIHEKISQQSKPSTPFQPNDVRLVLEYAWKVYRWFYVAWLHPNQLTALEGLGIYYKQLPAWRCEQYEIYRIRPELFNSAANEMEKPLTIPHVVTNQDLRCSLEEKIPGAVEKLEGWLREQLVKDLYHFGNHPELRLCSAIALWKRLADTGLWDRMVEATYRKKLYEISVSTDAICA